jgi:hypothetical protein
MLLAGLPATDAFAGCLGVAAQRLNGIGQEATRTAIDRETRKIDFHIDRRSLWNGTQFVRLRPEALMYRLPAAGAPVVALPDS